MTLVAVRVTAETVTHLIMEDFQTQWEEYCDDNNETDDPIVDYPPITEEFVIECYAEAVEGGEVDLDDALDGCNIDVRAA